MTITVDGAAVEATDSKGSGGYSYTVDFPAILEQWNADHPAAGADTADGSQGAPAASNS